MQQDLSLESAPLRIGNAVHECAEIHPVEGVDESFREATALHPTVDLDAISAKWGLRPAEADLVADMYGAWCEWLPAYMAGRVEIRREVALAWNTETWTARELPRAKHRDYSACLYEEIPCTVDLVVLDGEELEVIDYKTGMMPVRAEGHAQLALCGLAAAHLWGRDRVRVTIARVRPEGVTRSSVVLAGALFDETAASLQYYLAGLDEAEPAPGGHCALCPAVSGCPAVHGLVDQIRAEVGELAGLFLGPPRTNRQAARLKLAIKPLERLLNDLKGRLEQYADEHNGITMPDGSVERRVEIRVRKVDPANAQLRSLLVERFGEEGLAQVLKRKESMSVAAIERLARAGAARGAKDQAAMALMAEVAKTGALSTSTQRRWSDDDDE